MVIALAAIPRPVREIATLIINPATGKQLDEEMIPVVFADELKQAQAKYDLLCSRGIAARMREGSDAAMALWARNKWGWDRPNRTMTLTLPGGSPDIPDGKIVIEMVRAPKRDENGDFIE
jgi:hypothetical protein